MKRIYVLLTLFLLSIGIMAQDYYWYRGKKIYYQQIEEQMASNSIFSSKSPTQQVRTYDYGVTNRFLVKLNNINDYVLLMQYANSYNVESVAESSLPLWYILTCSSNTYGNALSLANIFYESSQFAAAEPEHAGVLMHTCVNDTLFNRQWYLNNTGQNGDDLIGWDINYCAAHAITSGNGSGVIALIDHGVDSTHEDIHQPEFRYDIQSMMSQDSLYDYPGTAAAGIIGAFSNNITGIAGIAPGCSLMSISIPPENYATTTQLAEAIMYAATHGANIINCPWTSFYYSEAIYDAINYALTQGRNGFGCTVVCGSGNFNGPVMFPAETHDDIIVVGAIDTCGTRKAYGSCSTGSDYWGSCYGDKLDVVAPGMSITTADIVGQSNYNYVFQGTSAACAQVSAIAGLIFSIAPSLSPKEVSDIICSSARKVGDYSYDSIAPSGNWNFEMGYGLVDANVAVKKAQLSLVRIDGPNYLCSLSNYFYARNVPNGATLQWNLSNRINLMDIVGSKTLDSVYVGLDFTPKSNDNPIDRGGIFPDPPFPPNPLINDTTATLSLTITQDGVSYTIYKTIYRSSMGTPKIAANDTCTNWLRYTERTFTVTNCTEVPDYDLDWTIRLVYPTYNGLRPWTYTGRTITFEPIYTGTYEVTVKNELKHCGDSTATKTYYVVENLPAKGNAKTMKKSIREENKMTEKTSNAKFLRDGHIYIKHEEKIYNAQGTLVE